MIRRQVGDEFWLIAQHDHALLAGLLAQLFGNETFATPAPRAIRAVALHDCGWPVHDERPTLNPRRQPLDVFETPRAIGLRVWTESADRAAAEDAYAGLLVSLHSLSLSIMATATTTPFAHERFDMSDVRARFELNQFQHGQIELQEQLRQRLGMRTDLPLRHGLAEGSDDAAERQLTFDFRLLQAMDKLSLGICCTKPPAPVIEPLVPAPGMLSIALRISRPGDSVLLVEPWPFAVERIELSVPFRRLPGKAYENEESFRSAYRAAGVEEFAATVSAGHE